MSIKNKKESTRNPINNPTNINQICRNCELRKYWCDKYKAKYHEYITFDYYDCFFECPYELTEYQLQAMEQKRHMYEIQAMKEKNVV